jgi:hypothetical protein
MSSFADYLKNLPSDKNFSAQTDSLSFENKNGKLFVLLFSDIIDSLKILWIQGEEIDKEFNGDWKYEETNYRRVFGNAFSGLNRANTVATNLGSQTPNTVRALELYAGFLLGIEPGGALSDCPLLRWNALAPLFNRRSKFQKSLESTGKLTPKSIKEYTGAIGGVLTEIAGTDLYAVKSSTELALLTEAIRKTSLFIQRDSVGNGMYGAALNRYKSFIDGESPENTEKVSMVSSTPFTSSLLGKPFLILTGPSGTGKTRTALSEAIGIAGYSRCKLIAVGADWTDNRHVLGFLNPITSLPDPSAEPGAGLLPVYEPTAILDLILAANEEPGAPYFLILDEMNLSHVERYFADFLSAMELSNKTGALKLHSAGKAVTRDSVIIAEAVDFPSNLFVVGTVNVDETTYMFSPKVLDRATVIEIRAGETELHAFLLGDRKATSGAEAADYGVSFLEAAELIRNDLTHEKIPALPVEVRKAAADHLMELFNIMKQGRFEFGFRTGKEILHSLRAAFFLAGPDEAARAAWLSAGWENSLDEQILRKILPKLHGSKSRLSPLLGAIATYCETADSAKAKDHFPVGTSAAKRGAVEAINAAPGKFFQSQAKLQEMFKVLQSEQFVSFIC